MCAIARSAALVGFAISLSAGVARADTSVHVGFKPMRAAGVVFSSLDLNYVVKDGVATTSVACVARAERGRAKRIAVDFFIVENDRDPAIAAAQSPRGIAVSETSDSYCSAAGAPIADPHRVPTTMRMKVTNFDTGEFTEVGLEPVEKIDDGHKRRRHRRR